MRKNISLDLEFTPLIHSKEQKMLGLNHEIIQIGAILMDEEMNVEDQFCCFVKPEYGSVSPYCTQITGITNYHVRHADLLPICITNFLNWIGEGLENTYIYSWSDTDLNQMMTECAVKEISDNRLKVLQTHWIDFQKEFGGMLGFPGRLSLLNALKAMDMKFSGQHHNALEDAENMAYLMTLTQDEQRFCRKATAIRSLFQKESLSPSLGELFAKEFAQCCVIS